MSRHDQKFYREIILEHIAALESYTPTSKKDLIENTMIYDAILMRLLAIGEELSSVRDILDENNAGLEWYKIIGLRNRIAHGYGEIDKNAIWELLTDGSLDNLKKTLE